MALVLAFVAGFFGGNGLPYYIAGSTGESVNPSPFPQTPSVNVLVGFAAMVVGTGAGYFTDWARYPGWSELAAAAGVLVVGLIHARVWRANPWRRGG